MFNCLTWCAALIVYVQVRPGSLAKGVYCRRRRGVNHADGVGLGELGLDQTQSSGRLRWNYADRMERDDAAVSAYLDRYARSLTDYDAETGASLWAEPGMIVDDNFSGVVATREEMTQRLTDSFPVYRKLGLGSVSYEADEIRWLTDKLVQVKVHWLFYDADGGPLTDSTGFYVLRDSAGALQACVCIQVDDVEKLTALARERGVDLDAPL